MKNIAVKLRHAGPKGKLLNQEELDDHIELVKTSDEEMTLQEFESSFNNGDFDDDYTFIHFCKKELSDEDFIRDVKNRASEWFDRRFNQISLDLLNKYLPEQIDFYVRQPHKVWIKEYLDNYDGEDEIDYKEVQSSKDYQNWIEENDKMTELEIIWSTVFEDRNGFGEEFYEKAEELGLVVIENADDDLGTMLGISGAGFDFYDAYWIPLYLSLYFNEKDRERYEQIMASRNE